jgi:hypothetical protein
MSTTPSTAPITVASRRRRPEPSTNTGSVIASTSFRHRRGSDPQPTHLERLDAPGTRDLPLSQRHAAGLPEAVECARGELPELVEGDERALRGTGEHLLAPQVDPETAYRRVVQMEPFLTVDECGVLFRRAS